MSDQFPPHQPPPPPSGPAGGVPPKHPKATQVLILGILGLVCCSILAPFAWIQGKNVHAEIQANPAQYSGESEANIGKILGIVGTVLLVISLIATVLWLIFAVILAASTTTTTY